MKPDPIAVASALELLALTDRGQLRPDFTLDAFARGSNGQLHAPELAYMQSVARYILLMCSRRAGKTSGIAGRYAKRSIGKPGGNRAYIALTKDQARSIMWEPIWKPLCAKWQLCDPADHNETRMITRFPNGSFCRFTGSDDVKHIATELGAALDEATIDEADSQPPHVLKTLADKILPPALGDRRGTLTLAGVVPEVRSGYFWDKWVDGAWENHNWSMFQNPHFANPLQIVQEYIDKHPGMTLRSPLILRDYYGDTSDAAFDSSVTAYTYERARNGYQAEPPEWLRRVYETGRDIARDRELLYAHPMREDPEDGALFGLMASAPKPGVKIFSLALDPGGNDRCTIQGWGWGPTFNGVQHVVDWSSPRGKRLSTGQMFAILGLFYRVLGEHARAAGGGGGGGVMVPRYDTTSQNTIDNLQGDYGIPLVLAAKKTDLKGQVDRNSDLLSQGRAIVMIGSSLEQDYQRAQWDKNARAAGRFAWSSQWHPDPSEAGRYALQDFFDAYVEPPAPPKDDLERHRAEVRAMLKEAKENDEHEGSRDKELGWG